MVNFEENIEAIKTLFIDSKMESEDIQTTVKRIRYICKLHDKKDSDKYIRQVLEGKYKPSIIKLVIESNYEKIRVAYYNYMYRAEVETMDQIPIYERRLIIIQPIQSILCVVIAMECVENKKTTIRSLRTRYSLSQKIARKHYDKYKYLKNAQYGQWDS